MDSVLTKEEFDTKQHFTQPPAHYTEATLVKALEELGIGRPSTYAPTISTILGRRYITKGSEKSVYDRDWRSSQQYYEAVVSQVLWMSTLRQTWKGFWIWLKKERCSGKLSSVISIRIWMRR